MHVYISERGSIIVPILKELLDGIGSALNSDVECSSFSIEKELFQFFSYLMKKLLNQPTQHFIFFLMSAAVQ